MSAQEMDEFTAYIATTLEQHPEWTSSAIDAVCLGARLAQQTMQKRIAVLGRGLLGAMCFVENSNVSSDMRTVQAKMVTDAYNEIRRDSLSAVELAALDKIEGHI